MEYIELAPEISCHYRYTGMIAFQFPFFQRASQFSLPYHFAWKKRGNRFFWKREKLLFDVLPFANRIEVLSYPRKEIYAPLKKAQDLFDIERKQAHLLLSEV
ncbi:MAG: hypothetical protein HY324_02405 [Chlamydiia bacterium]|nr:hypothetical protein [Chlamydiia bacterium]